VSEWLPAFKVLTASAPLPEAKVADPIALLPSMKVILPVAAVGGTPALSEIGWPARAVTGVAARVTALGRAFTWIETAFDVEAPSAASPAYDAVIVWVPAASDGTLKLAVPLERAAVPSEMAPSSRVIVPVGVGPDAAVMATLKVKVWPALICAADAERVVVVGVELVVFGCRTNSTDEGREGVIQ